MNRIFIIFALLFNVSTFAMAQSNYSEAYLLKKDTLNKLFYKIFSDHNNETNLCINSVVFAEFCISDKGQVTNLQIIEYDKRFPVFGKILKELVMSTNGLWKAAKDNGKDVESKPILLPMIFEMDASCKVKESTVSETNKAFMSLFNDLKPSNVFTGTLMAPLYLFRGAD